MWEALKSIAFFLLYGLFFYPIACSALSLQQYVPQIRGEGISFRDLATIPNNTDVVKLWELPLINKDIDISAKNVVMHCASDMLYILTDTGKIVAIHIETRKVFWKAQIPQNSDRGYGVFRGQLKVIGNVLVLYINGSIRGFDKETGREIWHRSLRTFVKAPFASIDTVVIARLAEGKTLALDTQTGKMLWSHTAVSQTGVNFSHISPVATRGSLAFLLYPRGKILALEAKTGYVKWTQTLMPYAYSVVETERKNFVAKPYATERELLVVAEQGPLFALDILTGKILWEKNIGSDVDIVGLGNVIYVLNSDFVINALNRETGDSYWSLQLEPQMYASDLRYLAPVIQNGRLILFNSQGKMHILSLDSGKTTAIHLQTPFTASPVQSVGKMIVLDDAGIVKAYR